MSGVELAPLGPGDIPDLVTLWTEAGLTRPWNDPTDDARLALAGPASTILGARVDDVLAVSVMVGWDGHRGAVYYLAVSPAHRGRGFGRQAMAAAEDWLARFNAPKLNLMVREDNGAAHGFYDHIGYGRDPVTVRAGRLRP